MSIGVTLKAWARRIKRDGVTLWFAGKHPGTPWYAKALGLFVVAYALSPIDLIPDFIPVLGYVDDVILLPVLIWLTVKLLPSDVLAQCRIQADEWMLAEGAKPRSRFGAVMIVALWLVMGGGIVVLAHAASLVFPEGILNGMGVSARSAAGLSSCVPCFVPNYGHSASIPHAFAPALAS